MALEVPGHTGSSRGHLWESEPANTGLSRVRLRLRLRLHICEPPAQPRCAVGRSRLCRVKPRTAARWRHSCSSACRPGPLQIRVCGKRGGAETRPGRGEDGPAGQTDRGPGGRRAAQPRPPWIRRQPGPGLPTCPPGGSSTSGPEGTGDPDGPVLTRWPPRAHPSAWAPQRGWRPGLRVSPLEDSGPPGRCSAPSSRRGQRPGPDSARTWAGEAKGREGELAGGAGRGAALAQLGAWQRGGWGAGWELPPPRAGKPGRVAAAGNGPRGPAGQEGSRVGRRTSGQGSAELRSGPRAAWLPKLGAERKSWESRDWGWPASPGLSEVGKLFPKFGAAEFPWRRGRRELGREAPGPANAELRPRPGPGRGWGAGQGQGRSRLCAVPARGAAPSLPWELRGSPLPPTCFLPQPPAPI